MPFIVQVQHGSVFFLSEKDSLQGLQEEQNVVFFFLNKDNVHCAISVFYCRQVRADGQHQSKDKASACFYVCFQLDYITSK